MIEVVGANRWCFLQVPHHLDPPQYDHAGFTPDLELVQFLLAHEAKAALAEHFLEMLFCTHPAVLGTQIEIFFSLGAE